MTLKVKVKVQFTLEQTTKTQRGSRGIALHFPYPRYSMAWVVNATPWPLYPKERPGTHCIGGWVEPRAGLDGCGKSRLHRDSILRSSGRPVRSESLYGLLYPGPSRVRYIVIYKYIYILVSSIIYWITLQIGVFYIWQKLLKFPAWDFTKLRVVAVRLFQSDRWADGRKHGFKEATGRDQRSFGLLRSV